ncbi:hypothetical protein C0992_006434, partial [Termitomyces sp. T32_za158]
RLGNSGLKVSRIILGTMQYGTPQWQEWVLGEEEAIKHIKFAYVRVVAYSNGLSEIILGKAIKQLQLPREEIVILTKVYFTVARDDGANLFAHGTKPDELRYVNQHGLSRKSTKCKVRLELELRTSKLDISYTDYAITHNLTPFVSMQNHHSILYREEEREMFPTLKLFGVGAIPWSPLARGLLTRPMKEQTKRGETDQFLRQYLKASGTPEIVRRVEDLAQKKGLSMAQVAVLWSLSKEGVTAPIVGTTSLKNLEELIGEFLSLSFLVLGVSSSLMLSYHVQSFMTWILTQFCP